MEFTIGMRSKACAELATALVGGSAMEACFYLSYWQLQLWYAYSLNDPRKSIGNF